MSKSFRRLCSALTKEQTQSLENVQRWALQIIFCNSPCGLSFGTLQRSSLCDRRRELCESSFRQIVRDESHVLHYLLPAKRVTHFLLTDCKQQRHFHYSTRGQGLKNPFFVSRRTSCYGRRTTCSSVREDKVCPPSLSKSSN